MFWTVVGSMFPNLDFVLQTVQKFVLVLFAEVRAVTLVKVQVLISHII